MKSDYPLFLRVIILNYETGGGGIKVFTIFYDLKTRLAAVAVEKQQKTRNEFFICLFMIVKNDEIL